MLLLAYMRISAASAIFVACSNVVVNTSADEPSAAAPQERMEAIVQQLGDDSPELRECASQQLLKIGLDAKATLERGMKHRDPEIAIRCRRLWDEVRISAGWQQIRDAIGGSSEMRALYNQMFLAEPAFWYELAEEPRPLESLFPERRTRLQQALKHTATPTWIIEGALANAFFFGVQAKQAKPELELESLEELLRVGRCQQVLKDNDALSDLWDMWAKATASDGPALDRLLVALRNPRSSTHEIARKIARDISADERISAAQRQYAVLALAKFNDPVDEELVQKWLNDSSPLDTLFTRGVVIKSQLGDVALAATIYRAGQDPREFGFSFLKPDLDTLYSPSTLGFENEEQRTQAVKNWSAFVAEQAGVVDPDMK